MYKIIIKEASFLCNIGVPEKERKIKQKIIVDLELFLITKKMAKPFNTVDYSGVYDLLKDIVEKKEYKLIETIAENVAQEILNKFPAEKVLVRVKKPKALADRNVKYVAVEIRRTKNF